MGNLQPPPDIGRSNPHEEGEAVNVLSTLQAILDQHDDPAESADEIRAQLVKVKKALRKSVDDEELREYISDYLEAWMEPDAIEDDAEAFTDETREIIDELGAQDDDEDEEEDED